jgi:hypothetical protein
MKLTKCGSGHFYDADKYDSCPHCASKSNGGGVTVATDSPVSGGSNSIDKTYKLTEAEQAAILKRDKHEPPKQAEQAERNEQAEVSASPEPEPPKQSLREQVSEVTSHGAIEDVKTVGYYNVAETEPVVGWLVCVKGAYIGQSFNLKTGRNSIGRAMNMDVPLAREASVSRNTHAVLTYEPQKRVFYIQAGESSGLTYLNGELVMTFTAIKAYDKLQFGAAEFVFAPLCGEGFTWGDYIEPFTVRRVNYKSLIS